MSPNEAKQMLKLLEEIRDLLKPNMVIINKTEQMEEEFPTKRLKDIKKK